MAERIRVTGFRRPRMPRPPRRVSPFVSPVRPMNLLWLVPILVVPALPDLMPRVWPNILPNFSGSPHLLLFSTSTGDGPFKFYTECAYVGLDGSMSHLHGTSCPTIRFFKDRRS